MEQEFERPKIVYERPRVANWVGLFVSLTIIILAFFILLNAFSTFDERRKREALSSIQLEFVGLFEKAGRLFAVLKGSGTQMEMESSTTEPGEEAIFRVVGAQYDKYKRLEDYVQKSGRGGNFGIVVTPRGMVVSIGEELTFEKGSSVLTAQGREFLNRLINIIRPYRNDILIEGHTDAEGPQEYNWQLSQARALSVLLYMNNPDGTEGIKLSRLSAAGAGQWRPLVAGEDEETLSINRRVEIIVKHPYLAQPEAGE